MNKRNTPNLRMVSWFLTLVMILPLVATVSHAAVVNFLSPLPGQASTGRYVEVAVSFNTQSDLAVTKLELWIDGKIFAKKNLTKPESRGVCSFQWDTAGYVNGSHFLLVKMFAGNREIASISGAGNVGASNSDMIPPLVKFTNIKPGSTVKGTQVIKITALDNSGQSPLVSLLVDQKLKLLKNTPPYIYDLDTTSYDDGRHEIQTYAFDAEGNKSDVVTLSVVFANGKVASSSIEAPAAVTETVATAPKTIIPNEIATDNGIAARAVETTTSGSLSGNRISVAATGPGKIIETAPKPVVQAEIPAPKPVAQAKTTAPKPVLKTEAVALVTPKKVEIAKPVESVKTVETPVIAQVSPAKPNVTEPVVVAKLEPVARPSAKLSSYVKNVTAARNPAKVRVERPLMMASSDIAAPAIPAYTKPAVVKTAKTAPVATKPTAKAPVVAVAPKLPSKTSGISKPVQQTPVVSVPVKSKVVTKVKINQKQAAEKMILPEKPLKIMETPSPAPRVVEIQAPKPVKMAMAPKVTRQEFKRESLIKPSKATYDVRATELPKSGKMKIRDLVKSMGGVVLWDSETRTVTAYVKNMKIELRIGKGLVKVNGKKMKVSLVPYIHKGRTIIDVRLYDKACMVASKKTPVASTKSMK